MADTAAGGAAREKGGRKAGKKLPWILRVLRTILIVIIFSPWSWRDFPLRDG